MTRLQTFLAVLAAAGALALIPTFVRANTLTASVWQMTFRSPPERASMFLLGSGLMAVAAGLRRRRRAKPASENNG